jgi:ribosomal protein S15P/S13E
MKLEKLPSTWNIRQKGKWIKENFEGVDKSVAEVGKAETARRLGIYVGTLYNLYTRRKKPNYGRIPGRPKSSQEGQVELQKPRKGRSKRGTPKSPLKAIDTLLKSSKGNTFNNSLVQSVITILEDYSKTKIELKSREEQVNILLERIKSLEIELLNYRQSSKKESKERLNEVLERAKSALIINGD